MSSILATSPNSTRHFDMNIAEALDDINAAVILQQLDYWMKKEGVGVLIDGVKYIYNTYKDWTTQQFRWLSQRQFRNSMSILRSHSLVDVVQHKSKQWNQTNYYSLNYDRLAEFIAQEMAGNTETFELLVKADRGDENGQIDLPPREHSYKETKNTNQKDTAKQGDRSVNKKSSSDAAASLKSGATPRRRKTQGNAHQDKALEEEKTQKSSNPHPAELSASNSQNRAESEQSKQNIGEETNNSQVDYIVNKSWKDLIPLLDSAGVPINKTVKDLLKLYPSEKVEGAIALIKARKRESYIPNPSGYFVSALKGDWAGQSLVGEERSDCESNHQR